MYKNFKDMPIWKDAMEVAELTFRLTDILPKKEDYGLTSQLRRAALSVSGNIAEPFGRYHVNDKVNFYYYSRGSVTETMSHLEYGHRVGYFTKENVQDIHLKLENLHESINRLIKSLKAEYSSQSQSKTSSPSPSKSKSQSQPQETP